MDDEDAIAEIKPYIWDPALLRLKHLWLAVVERSPCEPPVDIGGSLNRYKRVIRVYSYFGTTSEEFEYPCGGRLDPLAVGLPAARTHRLPPVQ